MLSSSREDAPGARKVQSVLVLRFNAARFFAEAKQIFAISPGQPDGGMTSAEALEECVDCLWNAGSNGLGQKELKFRDLAT